MSEWVHYTDVHALLNNQIDEFLEDLKGIKLSYDGNCKDCFEAEWIDNVNDVIKEWEGKRK